MADKVLRFTAEDGGYGATIDRMAAKLREAFSGTPMNDLLGEADSKFTSFSDKVRFIREQLNQAKQDSTTYFYNDADKVSRFEKKHGTDPNVTSHKVRAEADFKDEQKTINRLIEALDELSDRVESESKKEDKKSETDRIVEEVKPGGAGGGGRIPGGGGSENEEGGGGKGSFMGGLVGGLIGGVIGNVVANLAERLIQGIGDVLATGNRIAATEAAQATIFRFNPNAVAPQELGVKNEEYLEARGRTATSRRNGANIDEETLNRLRLGKAYSNITPEQFSGLDRFFRIRNDGQLLDKSQFDAGRTIVELLNRSEREGILGVSKGDFTMLPEKIGQVTSIMNQQYSHAERTDANNAINMIMAGNKIGGRFADDRAADTFGKLNEGITNPRSPAWKAVILEAIRRQHPEKTPLELEAQMQGGIYDTENLKAIFPLIQNIRSREVRGRLLQGLGLDAQSSLRLADAKNLTEFTTQSGQGGLTASQYAQSQKEITTRAENATLENQKAMAYFSNTVTAFGSSVVQFGNSVLKFTTGGVQSEESKNTLKSNKVVKPPF